MTEARQHNIPVVTKHGSDFIIKGFLTKKSTGLFGGSNSRYWRVDESGLRLYYYLNNDAESLSHPCNFFNIDELNVEEGATEEQFILKTPESNFVLRAESEQQKRLWMRSIFMLKRRIIESRKQEKKEAKSDHTLTTSSASPEKARRTTKLKVLSSLSLKTQVLPLDMEAINRLDLASYIRYLSPDVITHNILSGHLKILKGNYFTKIKQKFFVLFSSKSLYPEKHMSEHFLLDSQLPPWLQINCMYEIDESKKSREKLFHVRSILSTTTKDDESKSQNQYMLEINIGHRVIQLIFDIVALRDRWKQLLQLAKKNASEVEKSGGGYIKRNVDLLLKELKQKNLDKKLFQFYQEIRPQQYEYSQLASFLKRVEIELEEIREAVLAKQPKQLELLHFYFDFFHEKVFLQIKLCWDSHFEMINTLQMVQLLGWIDEYTTKFREQVQDNRFQGGIKALLRIFGRRMWSSLKPMIMAVAQNDKADNFFEEEGKLYSNSTVDLFKLLNDSFIVYSSQHSSKAVVRMLGHVARLCIELYLKILQETVDQSMISERQLAAISNNVIWFNRFLKDFSEAKLMANNIEQMDVNDLMQPSKLTKMYADLTSVTRNKLASSVCSKITKLYQTKKYPQVLLETVISLINEHIQAVQWLHQVNKRAFWKILLEYVTGQIIRSLAANSSEKQKQNRERCVSKLHSEIELIKGEFTELVMQVTLKLNISRLENILVAMTSIDHQAILDVMKSEDFKAIVKVSHMVRLLDYRKELPKSTYELLQSEINKISDQREEQQMTRRRSKSKRTDRKTITMPDGDVQNDDELLEQGDEDLPTTHLTVMITEGYMLKKKSDRKLWEKRYFRITEGVLYWYQDKESVTCQNQIPLIEVAEVYTNSPTKMTFFIKWSAYGIEKEYKFKCASIQERNNWMNSIIATVNNLNSNPRTIRKPKKIEEKATLFVDYEGISNPHDDFEDITYQLKSPGRVQRREPNSPQKLGRNQPTSATNLQKLRQTWKETNIKPVLTGRSDLTFPKSAVLKSTKN